MTENNQEEGRDHWPLARDIAVLQVKLIVDGLRDLILVPASLVAGLISIVSPTRFEDSLFYRLICMGKQSEQWINLFGAYDNASDALKEEYELNASSIDDVVSGMEGFVVSEYQNGGVTRQAKDKIDAAIREIRDGLNRRDG